jgi:hypothetical protein
MAEIKIIGNVVGVNSVLRYKDIDRRLISSYPLRNEFGLSNDYIEYHITDIGGNLLNSDYNFKNYKSASSSGLNTGGGIQIIEVDPIENLKSFGFSSGEFLSYYNFFRRRISSDLFIKEISSDRTEIRTVSTIISDKDLEIKATELVNEISSSSFYKDFLLNFGNNIQILAVNIALVKATTGYEILFKLYEALPSEIEEKSRFGVVEEIIESHQIMVDLDRLIIPDPLPLLRGPNFEIEVDNKNTTSTSYQNYNTLVSSYQASSSSSYYQILSFTTSQSIDINVDYTDFVNFTRFGSAQKRIENFYNKMADIENYKNFISSQTLNSASTSSLPTELAAISASLADTIANFDGYEYYLYFESSSYSWPKNSNTRPFLLYSTGSSQVQSWMTASIASASLYDSGNLDNLTNTIPIFIHEDEDNDQYLTFVNMIGHYFDNIWIYLKSITDLYKANNNLEEGVSKDLVYYALRSLGVQTYNSKGNEDLDKYIVGSNSGSVDDYVNLSDEFLNNIPRQDLLAETYKRIYHNIPLLFKGKGTRTGLDNVNNIFGVTSSILEVKEFGGMTKAEYLKGYTTDKIRIVDNTITGSVLSPITSLEQETTSSLEKRNVDIHRVDVSFSPQNQIDVAISASVASNYPTFIIDDHIGDPRLEKSSSYPSLVTTASLVFDSTFTYQFDYAGFVRLIKFFDNSLFKTLRDYTPARNNISTGVTFRSPQLERIKIKSVALGTRSESIYDIDLESPEISEDNDYLYSHLVGDRKPFYTGEITGSVHNVYKYFEDSNPNPYLHKIRSGSISGFPITTGSLNFNDRNLFEHTDFNTLLNNVSGSRTSRLRVKLESTNITSSVELQDSYDTLSAHKNSRYDGSKVISLEYNNYTSASGDYEGDQSFGKTAAIDKQVLKLGLFSKISENRYLPKRNDTALKYLVDQDGSLTELNQRNKKWEEVQNTFISGDYLVISLFDNQKYSNQKTTDGEKNIYNSGYSYYPTLYYSGSGDDRLYFQYSAENIAKLFKAKNLKSNLYITGVTTPNYPLTVSGSKKVIYEIFENDSDLSQGTFDDSNLYTPGVSGSTSFPKYTVPEIGSYVFQADLDLTLQFASSNQSGSYTFQIIKNGVVVKEQTLAFTSSATLEVENFYSYFNLTGDNINTSLNVTPEITSQELTYSDINGIIQILPAGSTIYRGEGYTYAPFCPLGSTNLGATVVDPAHIPTASAYTLVDPNTFFNTGIQKCDNAPFYNTGDTGYSRFDISNYNMYSPVTGSSLTQTKTFSVQSNNDNYTSGDIVQFKFIENGISTSNYTASLSIGSLQVQLQSTFEALPFSTSSASPFISGSVSPDKLVLNTSLSGFIGYLFLPDGSASGSFTSSLYSQYGDVDYSFIPRNGDLMFVQYHGVLNEFRITGYELSGSKAVVSVSPELPTSISTSFQPSQVEKVLFLTKIKDEQNVILRFAKREGSTSYGLIIPKNIHPDVLANIDTITSEIKTKLIETGQISGSF